MVRSQSELAGVLLTRVLYRKRTSRKEFVVVDAAMNDLIRPALYQSHHEIIPLRKNDRARRSMPGWPSDRKRPRSCSCTMASPLSSKRRRNGPPKSSSLL